MTSGKSKQSPQKGMKSEAGAFPVLSDHFLGPCHLASDNAGGGGTEDKRELASAEVQT